MALKEFWDDVRSRNPLFREGVSPPDLPRITADELDAALAGQQSWHTLGALKGYDEKDYDFLSPTEQARLTALVAAFNAVAPELRQLWYRKPTDESRLAELIGRARPALRDILLLLEQDRYRSPDALRFGKQVELEVGDLRPDGVVDMRFQVGADWSGDPAFFAWAFVTEEASATEELLFAFSRRVRPLVTDAMYRVAPGHFCYLSFQFLGEEIPEDEEVAA